MFQSLVVALTLSRLDYCNSVLTGLPDNLIYVTSPQSAQDEHLWDSSSLPSHHRCVYQPECILFKIVVRLLSYRALNGYLPPHLTCVADVPSRQRLYYNLLPLYSKIPSCLILQLANGQSSLPTCVTNCHPSDLRTITFCRQNHCHSPRPVPRAAVGIEFQSPYPSHTHSKIPWESPRNPHTHRTPKSSILILQNLRLFVRCILCGVYHV